MAGKDDKVDMIGDSNFPNPSPRTLMSNLLNDEFFGSRSFSDFGFPSAHEREKVDALFFDEKKVDTLRKKEVGETSNDFSLEPNWSGANKSNSHGGLAERMAASGFNVPKLDTARVSPANMAMTSSDVRSPYLTIPPGLSPTSLLESPVFLSNSLAQPSPTTGKLQITQNDNTGPSSVAAAATFNKTLDALEDVSETFAFKPPLESHTYSSLEKRVATDFRMIQTFPSATVSVQLNKPKETGISEAGTTNFQNEEFSFQADNKDGATANMFNQGTSDPFLGSNNSVPPDDQQDGDMDLKEELSSVAVSAMAEDGFNWRKYGQKQVKGSEYPRSYYKCTHSNCQVKKKVERSQEGNITEIIYKGNHNHPKPPPNRRSGVLSSHPFNDSQMDGSEQLGLQVNSDGKPLCASSGNEGQDWQGDCMEATSSALVTTECCDPSVTMQQTPDGPHISSDAIDVSSTMSNDEEDDQATNGSVSLVCDGEGDESESKRLKLDASSMEMNAASRAVREPRVVVQTTSEVDILDDGYRWRKYGQKVVKGNPNPRSYYKCTHPGCNVRKHVERAAHDLKSVITTYEGKHNHEVPAARNSNHPTSASTSLASNAAPQSHGLLPRPEPTQAAGLMRFEGHAPLNAAYSLPGVEQLRPTTSFTFPMSQPGLANLAMAGLGPLAPMKMPVLPPGHSYLGHPAPREGGFMKPKGEPKDEPVGESRLPMPNGGSMYHKVMNGVPLGPQL